MRLNTLGVAHHFLEEHVPKGGFCIDATAGRGRDTAFLCRLVGEEGKVLAFDIQPQAVQSTNELLVREGLSSIGQAVLDSHANLDAYAPPCSADAVVFNFGFLPGADHTVYTQPQSSIAAINKGLDILRPGGLMTLCIYYGGDTGYEERDALLAFLPTLDSKQYTVLQCDFCNRGGEPPIPVLIWKSDV